MHVGPYLSSDIKLNSQWIKDLNRSPENLNFIKETVENNNFEFTDDRKVSKQYNDSTGTKADNIRLRESEKCLYDKGHYHLNQAAGYRMREDLYLLHIQQRVNT